jgi:hypothetical protein
MQSSIEKKYVITLEMSETELHDLIIEIDETLKEIPDGSYGLPEIKGLKESINESLIVSKDNSLM